MNRYRLSNEHVVNKGRSRCKITAGLIAIASLILLTGCSANKTVAEEDTRPTVRIGSDSYPPYNYLDEDGNATGIDIDLAREAFSRMGYQTEIVYIDWEMKTDLVDNGEIDCIWGCFSMEGRLDDYKWAGSYMVSKQVVAVKENSDIYSLSDLEGKNIAVQVTAKPDGFFSKREDERIPQVKNLISLGRKELMYTFLAKDYVDAIASHETYILQYMKDYDVSYRILDEPLMTVGIGVAFSKNDERGICEELNKTLKEMREDGSAEKYSIWSGSCGRSQRAMKSPWE